MKHQLTYFEYFIIIALMLKGVDLLNHPAGPHDSTLAWSLLLVPAIWFHLQILWRQFTTKKSASRC